MLKIMHQMETQDVSIHFWTQKLMSKDLKFFKEFDFLGLSNFFQLEFHNFHKCSKLSQWCNFGMVFLTLILTIDSNWRPENWIPGRFFPSFNRQPDPKSKFSALKDLNHFEIVSKVQEAISILRVGFALSKWPLLHWAY